MVRIRLSLNKSVRKGERSAREKQNGNRKEKKWLGGVEKMKKKQVQAEKKNAFPLSGIFSKSFDSFM